MVRLVGTASKNTYTQFLTPAHQPRSKKIRFTIGLEKELQKGKANGFMEDFIR